MDDDEDDFFETVFTKRNTSSSIFPLLLRVPIYRGKRDRRVSFYGEFFRLLIAFRSSLLVRVTQIEIHTDEELVYLFKHGILV